jgi:hypothetical protein
VAPPRSTLPKARKKRTKGVDEITAIDELAAKRIELEGDIAQMREDSSWQAYVAAQRLIVQIIGAQNAIRATENAHDATADMTDEQLIDALVTAYRDFPPALRAQVRARIDETDAPSHARPVQ